MNKYLKKYLEKIKNITDLSNDKNNYLDVDEIKDIEKYIKLAIASSLFQRGNTVIFEEFNFYDKRGKFYKFQIPYSANTSLTEKEIKAMEENPSLIEKTKYDIVILNNEKIVQRGNQNRKGSCPSHITYHHYLYNIWI